ncbi:MAG: 50S ribosomal protein L29 [Bacteroidota bacterium]
MKALEVRQLSDEEIKKRIEDNKESLANLRFQKVLSQLENPMKINHLKKDIARMKTILRQREIQTAGKSASPEPKA